MIGCPWFLANCELQQRIAYLHQHNAADEARRQVAFIVEVRQNHDSIARRVRDILAACRAERSAKGEPSGETA